MNRILTVLALLLTATTSNATEVPTGESSYKRKNPDFDDAALRYFRSQQPKIVNGQPASPAEFPWQVSLSVAWIPDPSKAHFCGGSIYGDRWIVTAAHCLKDLTPAEVDIVSGVNRLTPQSDRHAVSRLIVHERYDPRTMDNDVALVELAAPLVLDTATQTIPLLGPDEEASALAKDQPLTVTGWGATTEGGSTVALLQKVDVPFVPLAACNDFLSYDGRVTANMICAGRAAGGQDSCQGDSGGPLAYRKSDKEARLAGIVSWGEGCARPGRYGIYTRVPNYVNWIQNCTERPDDCR